MSGGLHEVGAAVAAHNPTALRAALRECAAEEEDELLAMLASAGAAGSALATEVLIERLDERAVITRMVRAALLDEAAVDDVSQDVLISVAASLPSFRGGSKVTTWLHTIVRHRVVDHLRRQRATVPLAPEDLTPSQRMSSILATRSTVRQALSQLPALYREPVVLRDLEGLGYAEIAERLERNVGTVKAQISRGRALVAGLLREEPIPQAPDA